MKGVFASFSVPSVWLAGCMMAFTGDDKIGEVAVAAPESRAARFSGATRVAVRVVVVVVVVAAGVAGVAVVGVAPAAAAITVAVVIVVVEVVIVVVLVVSRSG